MLEKETDSQQRAMSYGMAIHILHNHSLELVTPSTVCAGIFITCIFPRALLVPKHGYLEFEV